MCAGRHSNLVISAIVADHRPNRMAAMTEIVARLRRIIPTRVAHAIMNRVMPIEIMIGVDSVPPAIMRLKHLMRPANAGVCTSNHNSFSFESERPDIRRMGVNDTRLDRRRPSDCCLA
jgi:hypothetical protein